ncbi:Transmembrane ion channel [Trichostrongylus colubriformis]|uniref:Transmembrane ion channel n=1 Tax=Trichostrongylus colubriformis TaxID=6319 RepID=A0AAN8EYJ0_TRICO
MGLVGNCTTVFASYHLNNLPGKSVVYLQDGKNQIIELNAWLKFVWVDYRLSWNASKYGGVTSIRFAGGENQIWRPDVLLYNSANEDFDATYKSNEVVYSTGEVNWVPPGIFRASCKMDITYFPFDDQLCHLKFGSWTYNGNALDLQIITEHGEEPAMDLSTYTPSGEWNLIKVPAVREVFYSKCCPEPYSTVTFYMLLRRRSIFYLFNIVFPSLLISLMTLVGFCLPAHDMSEKIGYQTTILLSICFFVTIVSEMTPPTSESVPLLGMFFSTLTLIVAVSTTFTITVLHFRYRHPYNTKMTPALRRFFLEWLPRMILMSPWQSRRRDSSGFSTPAESCQPPVDVNSVSDFQFGTFDSCGSMESLLNQTISSLRKERNTFEKLNLQRKIGDGILTKRSEAARLKKSRSATSRDTLSLHRLCASSASFRMRPNYQSGTSFIKCYSLILKRLKEVRQRSERMNVTQNEQEEWKFAALALDRLCLILFTFLIVSFMISVVISTPHFEWS